jgi:hypothetical protein
LNTTLKPTYQYLIGEYWVLWYEVSNSYSIVLPEFKNLLDQYLIADSHKTFTSQLVQEDNETDPKIILEQIEDYLNSCNQLVSNTKKAPVSIDTTKRSISKKYSIKGKIIQIHYDCELVLKIIHPALAHYSNESVEHPHFNFDIYIKDEQLHLYKDEQLISCVPKRDYHLIQGKFIMQLLCLIHEKEESDWIGTFHGSTITDGNTSILFIGKSGKGKSTLCALLANNEFKLLADDVSPMLSKTKHIFFNPSAVSIKEGAFNIINQHVKNFKDLPEIEFNKYKGLIRYLPCDSPEKKNYPCRSIIIVNYKKGEDTVLEKSSIKEIMETLIPDSWLSPNSTDAKLFLEWLQTVKTYQLTYSNTQSVTNKISECFSRL